MGKSLDDLGLKDEVMPQMAPEDIPAEFGSSAPPPYPGTYKFRLPADMSKIWDVIENVPLDKDGYPEYDPTLEVKKGQRITAQFRDDHALVIENGPGGMHVGEALNYTFSNLEIRRGKRDDASAPRVSDMTFLLRGIGSANPAPGNNKAQADELKKFAGKAFKAKLEWTSRCAPDRDAYFDDGKGGVAPIPAEGGGNQQGCGHKVFMRDWPKDESGRYYDRITCPECQASLRPFARLSNFAPGDD